MERFKRRTLALILASTITVAGAFGANNYKNCLMELNFENTSSGINMVLQTKTPYSGNVTPLRKDANTFMLILPETDTNAPTPNIVDTPNIESVKINKYPYTQNSKGYLKILIKTHAQTNIQGQNKIYVPAKKVPQIEQNDVKHNENISKEVENENKTSGSTSVNKTDSYNQQSQINKSSLSNKTTKQQYETDVAQFERQKTEAENIEQNQEKNFQYIPKENNTTQNQTDDKNLYNYILYALGALLFVLAIVFFIVQGKEKLNSLNIDDIDVDDNEIKPKKNNLKTNINKLDKMYSKNAMPGLSQYSHEEYHKTEVYNNIPKDNTQTIADFETETENIVDLDSIFKKQNNEYDTNNTVAETNNISLDDFLNDFSFDTDEEIIPDLTEENAIDEKLYYKIVNGNYKFNNEDIKKISELMQSEISEETLSEMRSSKTTIPIKHIKPNIDKIMETFILDYAINQNIRFNDDDAKILKKLVSVELDESFINDLKIDKEKNQKTIDEILFKDNISKQHKNETPKMLKVKDILPDLSKELKNYNKTSPSNYKPYAENYDEQCRVQVLKVDLNLFNENKNADNKSDNKKNNSDILLNNISEKINLPKINVPPKAVPQKNTLEKKSIQKPVVKTEIKVKPTEKQQEIKTENKKTEQNNNVCVLDNMIYSIIDNAPISHISGCYLTEYENQCYILGYIGKKIFKLKTYEKLKFKNIQCRLYKKLADGKEQYLVKTGLKKFLICRSANRIEFVMDL